MKTLVTYVSWTGNTRKVARAIFGELDGEKEIRPISEVKDLEGYGLVFVGFPIHDLGQPAPEAAEFLARHARGRKVALFVTHAAVEWFPLVGSWIANCERAAAGAEIVGVFHCQGELAPDQVDRLKSSEDPRLHEWARRALGSKGQPDETRLERARDFARESWKAAF